MSLKTLRFVFGHGVTHARITPDTTRIVPSGLMMFLIPVMEYILSMVQCFNGCVNYLCKHPFLCKHLQSPKLSKDHIIL